MYQNLFIACMRITYIFIVYFSAYKNEDSKDDIQR